VQICKLQEFITNGKDILSVKYYFYENYLFFLKAKKSLALIFRLLRDVRKNDIRRSITAFDRWPYDYETYDTSFNRGYAIRWGLLKLFKRLRSYETKI